MPAEPWTLDHEDDEERLVRGRSEAGVVAEQRRWETGRNLPGIVYDLRRALATVTALRAALHQKPDEMELRKLLWLRHHRTTIPLYGDDGKMDCNGCLIDFKTWPLDEIVTKMLRLRNERVTQLEAEVEAASAAAVQQCIADECGFCAEGDVPERQSRMDWSHRNGQMCYAAGIRERVYTETTEVQQE